MHTTFRNSNLNSYRVYGERNDPTFKKIILTIDETRTNQDARVRFVSHGKIKVMVMKWYIVMEMKNGTLASPGIKQLI